MDGIDRRIIQVLRADGRISNANLATAVGLSASACHRRVRLLEDALLEQRDAGMVPDRQPATTVGTGA